ncbi:1-acyl-sn-glycerol-3-phosphate acyltransferase [Pedobacter sandarakinus]|uniref:1-acyl-sn-glycerol-3-phosphate acyltransferase n=1 Tax=Pedobacter sandarakinus TaxID=353156 RepID=UPI0022480EC4|nr:1-acyl-sn-glycerol-3-phosphate acyltransferase [Pedobacter sandarakinus]MCX2575107.1 1-acyl-sn-glycerol-3-phosphate acyltransferase [Pedobacter sandarakinus]
MIKDKPNRLMKLFLNVALEPWILRHYSSIKFMNEIAVKPDQSCLMLMNHYSFNDGFLLNRICRLLLKKQLKAMVIESQMKAFPILKYFGCFSVSKKSRSMIDSLNYAAESLKDPTVMLGIYPQGGLYSMHLNKIHFVPGLAYIFKHAKNVPFQVFFGVTLLDYLENYKPVARVYFTSYEGERDSNKMEEAYNLFYQSCKQQNQRLYRPPESVVDAV